MRQLVRDERCCGLKVAELCNRAAQSQRSREHGQAIARLFEQARRLIPKLCRAIGIGPKGADEVHLTTDGQGINVGISGQCDRAVAAYPLQALKDIVSDRMDASQAKHRDQPRGR
ncbi:hypothetical protein, partial [Haliangium sp. UPWRP_2]|uniref:hypothetical protein n=1 Tax=Haliangium sp. UPWRP_2 TaxID=1931276 RepID=UPI0011B254BB